MKFGRNLRDAIEGMQPEFQDKFLCYKHLKKILKALPVDDKPEEPEEGTSDRPTHSEAKGEDSAAHSSKESEDQPKDPLTPEEGNFVRMLNEELMKFNEFYMEKEEEYVMNLQPLEDQLERLMKEPSLDALNALHISCVKFHGTLVLLQNWSALNYSALVKILKKHDKHSKLLLRSSFLANVLTQPFYSTGVLSELVTCTEKLYSNIMEQLEANGSTSDKPSLMNLGELEPEILEQDVEEIDPSIMRQTQTALNLWNKVKSMSIPFPTADSAEVSDKRAAPTIQETRLNEPSAKVAKVQ